MNTITIHFDGGCRPTNPGKKYGSYEISLDGEPVIKKLRLEFGWGTNNEAEFDALILALKELNEEVHQLGAAKSLFEVEVFTDSTIIANRLNGRNRTYKSESQARMNRLAQIALGLLQGFKRVKVQWRRREENVALFGH